ncbi:hypothetical protein TH53_04165 [Pedobacter lusitanus]|uniref:Lipoprotein n=1 Tax=Pedobacter lusitanus TaxID=1503925 RepID=A0A0D0GM80_9SPHI|nr:hypothetical protein [Pedobacter lusitanus]KIO78332.1 hypothetical protein TH53_04165 [Pedobacter lusitanus]
MKIIQFSTLLLASLLFAASCTQQTKTKDESVQDTLTRSGITANKPSKTDSLKPLSKNTCSQVVFKIMTTSASYKELTNGLTERIVKNGGTSFGFFYEGSPQPKIDSAMNYSKTYDYSVHESYPDHSPVIARYSFDPVKRQLFEYDAASDSLIAVPFNKGLLVDLDKACK